MASNHREFEKSHDGALQATEATEAFRLKKLRLTTQHGERYFLYWPCFATPGNSSPASHIILLFDPHPAQSLSYRSGIMRPFMSLPSNTRRERRFLFYTFVDICSLVEPL